MSALEGRWEYCPQLTEGAREFLNIIGVDNHRCDTTFILEISQDHSVWTVSMTHPDVPGRIPTHSFQSGVKFNVLGHGGHFTIKVKPGNSLRFTAPVPEKQIANGAEVLKLRRV